MYIPLNRACPCVAQLSQPCFGVFGSMRIIHLGVVVSCLLTGQAAALAAEPELSTLPSQRQTEQSSQPPTPSPAPGGPRAPQSQPAQSNPGQPTATHAQPQTLQTQGGSPLAPVTPPTLPLQQVERVPPEQALAILGSPVAEPDGKTVGRLVDVLVDDAGVPQAAVIDFGGFMGVGARKIAVHWSVLHFSPANPKQPITLNLTADQIKTAPEYINPAQPAPVVVPAQASAPPAAVPARPPSSSNSQ